MTKLNYENCDFDMPLPKKGECEKIGAKFTPGPWWAHLSQVSSAIVEMSDGHQFYIGGDDQDIDTIDANAGLIAAAPELIAFVQTIARMKQDGEEDENGNAWVMENDDAVATINDLIDQAREIVTRVRGQS